MHEIESGLFGLEVYFIIPLCVTIICVVTLSVGYSIHIYKKYGVFDCSHIEYFDPMHEVKLFTKKNQILRIMLYFVQGCTPIWFCFFAAKWIGWI